MSTPTIKMHDGNSIPQIGLGLWKVKDEEEFNASFNAAIAAGYTHFDTAQVYGNEKYLGTAWKEAGLNREDLFITTKIRVENITVGRTLSSFEKSLENLQTDYVDLILLHFPVTLGRKKAWKDLRKAAKRGESKKHRGE